jgi:uncharacterized membrane protein
LHPFDIKAALLAKHAQHVVLIHFPIALFIAGVTFDYLAQWTKQRILAAAAYCNLLAAAVFTVPVLITGLAVATGRPAAQGHLTDAPATWLCFQPADLDRMRRPRESAAQA